MHNPLIKQINQINLTLPKLNLKLSLYRNSLISLFLTLLITLNLLSAIVFVYLQDLNRQFTQKSDQSLKEFNHLQTIKNQLILEETTLSAQFHIEKRSSNNLNMIKV